MFPILINATDDSMIPRIEKERERERIAKQVLFFVESFSLGNQNFPYVESKSSARAAISTLRIA